MLAVWQTDWEGTVQVPLFAILLFGGPISINHVAGALSVGAPGGSVRVRMKAWPRIGVLVNELRYVGTEGILFWHS